MQPHESHIIREILNGKTEKYAYFLNRYGQQVFALVVRIVGSQEEAEEITQDVFLKAFQQLSYYQADSGFSTWIYRIAANMAISAVRKRKYELLHLDEAAFANLPDELVDEALDDEREWRLQRLSAAIERLDADERALLTLYYQEEKSIREVAYILKISESNAKVKLHRTRKKLYLLIQTEE